jgi:hypothetical protein
LGDIGTGSGCDDDASFRIDVVLARGTPMTVITKTRALNVIRRVYGPDHAESLAERLPERIDLDNAADTELLFELGITRDRLFSELGAEL